MKLLPKNAIYYFCKPNIPRGLAAQELQVSCAEYGLNGKTYTSVKKAPERTPLLKQLYEEEWQRASEEDRPRSSFFATPERGYM